MNPETGKTYKIIPQTGAASKYANVNAFRYSPMGLGVDPAKEYLNIKGQRIQRQSDKTILIGTANGDDFTLIDHITQPQLGQWFSRVDSDASIPVFNKDGARHNVIPKAEAPDRFKSAAMYEYITPNPSELYDVNGQEVVQPADKPVVLYGAGATDPGTDAPCLGFVSEDEFNHWFTLARA